MLRPRGCGGNARPLKCFRLSWWHPKTRLSRLTTLFSSITLRPCRVPLSFFFSFCNREKLFSCASVANFCHGRCKDFWSKYFCTFAGCSALPCHCAWHCEKKGLQSAPIILRCLVFPCHLVVLWEFTWKVGTNWDASAPLVLVKRVPIPQHDTRCTSMYSIWQVS